MKTGKKLLKLTAVVMSVIMLVSSVCVTALAAERQTPVGFIVQIPHGVNSPNFQNSSEYLAYKNYIETKGDILNVMYNGLIKLSSYIDVSSYNVTVSEMQTMLNAILLSFPELWYLEGFSGVSYDPKTSKVYYIKPSYLSLKGLSGMKKRFFEAAETRYLSLIDDSMDDFTKAVVLHDALVLNTYYTKDVENDPGNNYTYMVENYGVCQFYSECYAYLLAQCGIKSEIVTSPNMDHAWLKIQLDGKWYNVDSTWDDPKPDQVGRVKHAYFLFSDKVFQTSTSDRNKHYDYQSIHTADSKKYDSFDNLHSFTTELCRVDGEFYAITSDGKLVKYDHKTDKITLLKDISDFKWSAGNNYYYTSNYSSLIAYNDKLYYNSPKTVYEYDLATSKTKVFAQNTQKNQLFGLRMINGQVWGVNTDSPNNGYVEPVYMADLPEPVTSYTVSVDSGIRHGAVSADKETALEGETVTLTVRPDDDYIVTGVWANNTELYPQNGVYSFTMPAENVTVNAQFAYDYSLNAKLTGYSLSLEGDIGVKFYMELDRRVAESDTAYMRFTVPNEKGGFDYTDVSVKDAITTRGERGAVYHVFKCQVAAKQMTDEIRAQLFDGDKHSDEYTYSVKEYADYLIDHKNEPDYASAADVVKAMLNYGAYSQLYFDEAPNTLANDRLTEAEKSVENVTAETIGRELFAQDLPEGVSLEGSSLSLRSETTLSLFFAGGDDLNFSCGSKQIETSAEGGYKIVRIRDIPAKQLNDSFTVSVAPVGGTYGGTVSYSPMNYCYNVLASEASDSGLKDVVRALYLYWQAADRYFD